MNPPAKGLSTPQLAKVCGVSTRAVRNWLTEDTPIPSTRRGRRHVFAPAAVALWLKDRGKNEPLRRMAAFLDELETPQEDTRSREDAAADAFAEEADKPLVKTPRNPAQADAVGSLDEYTLHAVKSATARQYAQGMRDIQTATAIQLPGIQKILIALADLLRKLEIDCISVAREMGHVMLVSDVAQVIGEVLAQTKHELLHSRDSMVADLGTLQGEDQIRDYLDHRHMDLLRHLQTAFQKIAARTEKPVTK